MEQHIAYGVNVVQHNYSIAPNFEEKPLFFKFCKRSSRSGHRIFTCPKKSYINSLEKPKKQTFNQAVKGKQNLPNKQMT